MFRSPTSAMLIGLAAVAAAACTTITEEMPQRTVVNPVLVPIPVVVVPVPLPTPVDPAPSTPTPAPNPAPGNPNPAPVPSAPPSGTCSLGPGGGSGNNCPKTSPAFLDAVDAAINRVVQSQPGLFDLNDQRGAGGYRIRDIDAFLASVVSNLRGMGLCAIVDHAGEIAVKDSNSFSDQYDLILSSGHIYRGNGSYAATCRPAWF